MHISQYSPFVYADRRFLLMYNQPSWNNTTCSYQFGVTVPLPSPDFIVRFFFPAIFFFLDLITFIGSGVPVRKSSAVTYGGKDDVAGGSVALFSNGIGV